MLNIRRRDEADTRLGAAEMKLRGLAQGVIHAQEEERARIARELHDGVKPMLVVIKMKIEIGLAKQQGMTRQLISSQIIFKEATELAKDALEELDRIIRDIIPIDLERLGLVEALNRLVLNMRCDATRIELSAVGEVGELTIAAKTALFRVAQTALHNVVRHAAARNVMVCLECDSRCVRLAIRDDGQGFDVDRIHDDSNRGFGLRNMELRLEAIGGRLSIMSSSGGTMVLAAIPLS